MPEFYTKEILRVASVALHAMWTSHPDECLDCKDDMGPVLDAVAPLIAAEALRDAAVSYGPAQISGLFTSQHHYTTAWLRIRADRIERGAK